MRLEVHVGNLDNPMNALIEPAKRSAPCAGTQRAYENYRSLMARSRLTRTQRVTASAARGASWMSLLAATSLGITGADWVRTRISAGEDLGDGDLRLIVQSYRKDKLDGQDLPQAYAEPLASTQRSITAEELKKGINVSLLQMPVADPDADSVVVAWVEQGVPNLDFDALEARPHDGAYYGVAQHQTGDIVLRLARGVTV
jgi:hypothetical protein